MIKKTGIIRKIDELGRVVIPIELRNGLGWNEKESLEIYIESNKICIRQPKFEGRIDSVGIIRKLDELGRIVIPKEIRNKFDIAEKDLEMRGPGEFLGKRQHGLNEFAAASLALDIDALDAGQKAADAILSSSENMARASDLMARAKRKLALKPK